MPTTTQITNVAHMLDLTAYAGEFVDDYDMPAVHAEYVSRLNCELPDGITLLANGDVIAEVALAAQARDTDWVEVVDRVPVDDVLERHDVTRRITETPDGTRRGVDRDGNLIVAFGPDLDHDGDGGPAPEGDHWVAALYVEDMPGPMFHGTRAEVQAQARKWMAER